MARSRQFIDGWRHAENSLVAWLYRRARWMNDPRAQAILYVAANDYGNWSKGRYEMNVHSRPADPADPLVVFRAAVRSEALEEAAKIAEAFLPPRQDRRDGVTVPELRAAVAAIRKAKAESFEQWN